ncbi:myo-inositol transporter [Pichia californica]|nr:myo-inositol transporter [[Candida] californica]
MLNLINKNTNLSLNPSINNNNNNNNNKEQSIIDTSLNSLSSSSSSSSFVSDMFSHNSEDDDEIKQELSISALNNEKPSLLVIFLTILASISGFMFGYDTGYISSALVSIGKSFGKELSYGEEQFITAATSLGALIMAILSGIFVDFSGRKPLLMFSNIMFIVGAIIQCAAKTVWTMIVGRFIMGFGVGIGSLISPLYISELAPSKYRGRLVILNCLGITGGQLIAYGIGAGLNHVHNGWRIVVGLSMIPPSIQFISFLFLPDTPRYLIMKNNLASAENVLKKIYPNSSIDLIKLKIFELQEENDDNLLNYNKNPFKKWWKTVVELHIIPSNFRALFISCALQAIQQYTGFNSLMYFSSTIFQAIGFENSTAVSIIVAGTNFVFTIIAFFIIDRIGRRVILLISVFLMICFLVLNAIAFHFIDITFTNNTANINSNGIHSWGIVIIVAMICFVASYAVGLGNVPWQQSELFPQRVRGVGASYATASNWCGSLIISATFLTMLENITPTGTFALFAGFGLLSFILIFFCYPELSNLELEEVQELLTDGFHIKQSMKIAKIRKNSNNNNNSNKTILKNDNDTPDSINSV